MSIKLDGKHFSLEIQERLTKTISESLSSAKRPPSLAVVRIGDDPASGVYVANKERACAKVGINSLVYHLKERVSNQKVEQFDMRLKVFKEAIQKKEGSAFVHKFAKQHSYDVERAIKEGHFTKDEAVKYLDMENWIW